MTTKTQDQPKKARARSPSYPSIDLEMALSRAKEFFKEERMNSAAVTVALKHWGYTAKSGMGLVVLAALIKFGLLADEGAGEQRKVKLTELARRIILDDRSISPERDAAIREASLTPPIHRELWEQYKGILPSDENLGHELKFNKGFSDSGVQEFIRELRSTVAFAKLPNPGSISTEDGDKGQGPKEPEPKGKDLFSLLNPFEEPKKGMEQRVLTHDQNPKQKEQQIIRIPLLNNDWVSMQLPVPMSDPSWEQMMKVLTAMKPGLVERSATPKEVRTESNVTVPKTPLTQEARDLLAKIEAGGIPMYVNSNLEKIARENGIEVTSQMKPEEVIERLKTKAIAHE
jgi:hypothetical protein